jgi:hypothetical protein
VPDVEEADAMMRDKGKDKKPLAEGMEVWDRNSSMDGVIIDHASQFTHPQAAPIFVYMIRWEDGQVSSVSEAAFRQGGDLSVKKVSD